MRVIIIGGDAAGMTAAMEIVRNAPATEILVLERGGIYSYGQCGLPYIIDRRIQTTDELIARDVQVFRDKYGIDARTFHEVTSINTQVQIVRGHHVKTGEHFEFQYDKLLIATGAASVIPNWRNTELAGIHTIKSLPQMNQLMQDLKDVQHVTVIGGGYIGLEVVETLKERGLDVRLIQRGQQVMNNLYPSLAQKIHDEARNQGVELYLEEEVTGFDGNDRVEKVKTKSANYETDLVIIATGISPNTEFIQGLTKLENGAIVVNEKMETSLENIYAAGDCATHFHRIKKMDVYIPLGTTANKQGRIAGLNITGQQVIFKGIVGTAILKFFNLEIGMTGLNDKDLGAIKLDFDAYMWQANDRASYYPDVHALDFRLFVEKGTNKLLGIQMIGENGVDKRIDVMATALFNEMTLEQLIDLDLAYAPPFNGVWDALQQVAKRNV